MTCRNFGAEIDIVDEVWWHKEHMGDNSKCFWDAYFSEALASNLGKFT